MDSRGALLEHRACNSFVFATRLCRSSVIDIKGKERFNLSFLFCVSGIANT